MRVNPVQSPGKPGFRATFRNPYKGKVTTAGLGTRDDTEARALCNDLEGLSRRQDLWQAPESPELLAYDPRSVGAFFGVDSPHLKYRQGQRTERPAMDDHEVDAVATAAGHAELLNEVARASGKKVRAGALRETLALIPERFFARLRASEDRCRDLEFELKALRPRAEFLEAELVKFQRKSNLHTKVSVADAFAAFQPALKIDRKPKTQAEITDAVDAFVASLPGRGKDRLGEIKAGHVDDFLTGLTTKDGGKPSPRTRAKRRAGLSVFLTWAVKKYDLAENPMAKASRVTGAARTADAIVAIDRLEDLQQLLSGLKPWGYWQAWVSFACLGGARWGEQRTLKLDDVKLDEGYTLIRASKTGRVRRVPIERTFLRGVLAEHLKRRKAEQKKPTLPGHGSPWLFPSIVPDNEYKPRVKAEPGLWSDASVWHSAWERVQVEAKDKKAFKPAWAHGPAVWRHTFGTALGMCGLSNMQVAEMMGNSPEVAKRFYVASSLPPRPWPFVWLGTEPGAKAL
ncbi:MAG: tyrosine-type recombinase/integrase [Planctomycetes bacterium]|nr:tyrosine-type recombinase/integrase [Planctomycetota bacterium]